MSKSTEFKTTKLTGRTWFQIAAAHDRLEDRVVDSTKTSVTFNTDPATLVADIHDALAVVRAELAATKEAEIKSARKGEITALSSLLRAADKARAAWAAKHGEPEADAKPAKPAKAVKGQEADATRTTGPRGEILARVGLPLGTPQGTYVIKLPFREFTTAVAADKRAAKDAGHAPWVTVCELHGTITEADNGEQAERQGARKNRTAWCDGCRAGKPAEAVTGDGVPVTKAVTKAVAKAKAASTKAPARKAAKATKLPVLEGLMEGLATGDFTKADTAVKATKATARKAPARKAGTKATARKATARKAG